MASLPRRLLLQSRQCPSRIRPRAQQPHTAQWHRSISSTSTRPAKEDTKEGSATAAAAISPNDQQQTLAAQESASSSLNNKSPEEIAAAQLSSLVADLRSLDPTIIQDAMRKGQRGIPFGQDWNFEKDEDFMVEEDDKRKIQSGFWAEGEESMGPDEDYYGDDITSHGHGELQQHRDMREYSRLIAWEMPLLGQLAKPYELPTSATPFRFRYTSYFNTPHPAANKVVVEFCPTDLSLTPVQVNKLIKLAGPRYNPGSKLIKISCEKFDTQTQNKRFLGETIHQLITAAKDSKDTFEDVPFDFRHYKPKQKFKFPEEWIMTAERRKILDGKRAQQAKLEDEKVNNGRMIDGALVIDTSLPFGNEAVPEPVMVGGPRGKELRR